MEIANTGTAAWPVLAYPPAAPGAVFLAVEWRGSGDLPYAPPLAIERHALPRDVPAGEAVRVSLELTPPGGVAASVATLSIRQADATTTVMAANKRPLPFSDATGTLPAGPAS